MRRGHVSEKVAMEVGGWTTTSVFHRYAIVDNQDVADAMNMLEKSQDEQRQRLERAAVARNANGPAAMNDFSRENQPEMPTSSSEDSVGTSRLHHVKVSREIFARLHHGTRRPVNAGNYSELSAGAGRGSRTPKGRSPADFESNPFLFQTIHFLYLTKSCAQLCVATCEERFGLVRGQWSEFGQRKCYVNKALAVLQ